MGVGAAGRLAEGEADGRDAAAHPGALLLLRGRGGLPAEALGGVALRLQQRLELARLVLGDLRRRARQLR